MDGGPGHPGRPYELNVQISEPNGGSDLSTVEVMLASNQGSDSMSIQWTFGPERALRPPPTSSSTSAPCLAPTASPTRMKTT